MGRLRKLIGRLFPGRRTISDVEVEQLRIDFTSRYHSFRLLLEANRSALRIMTEIEEGLHGGPLGLTWVRALCTRTAKEVWRIIRCLDDLAPGKYGALRDRFQAIQKSIMQVLEPHESPPGGKMVLAFDDVTLDNVEDVGGKVANLGEIGQRLGMPVPGGFVVTASGFRRFLEHNDLRAEISRRIQLTGGRKAEMLPELSRDIEQLIRNADVPDDLAGAIHDQYRVLEGTYGEKVPVAVRSSALDEDVVGASVAGQYRSVLHVRRRNLLESYKEVVASKYSLQALTYRMNRGLLGEGMAMCVGVMPMIDSVAGGVLYSRNPVDSRDDGIVINSAWGLPRLVVEGRAPCDLFLVGRGSQPEIRERRIVEKPTRQVYSGDQGVSRLEPTGGNRLQPSLTDGQIVELARLAIRLEEHYGAPQDVEWAVDRDGSVVLLQTRELRLQQVPVDRRVSDAGGEPPGQVLAEGGITVSAGAASGPVFVVEMESDALNFPAGAVLVTVQPIPRWASLLTRASAMVAEHGSVAGHLANVAREYGVPAVMGMPDAMDRLEYAGTVTVDADSRTVYEGRIESLLHTRIRRKSPMAGTPLHRALSDASQLILPLNLLDPDAAEFRPESCATLHDLTRFCHEMAVREMFRFGKDHHFPMRSSKQLHVDVPMQWWVLNLDDGFGEEVEEKYVRLENIVSVPMLALWEGITAFPWEGPPPVDGKGFLSVMFEATTNRALTMGVRSRYVDRNYFMISRDYCSLNSRLGAHFCIIEALVGERTSENFVSFQFKGGAADFDRRLRRVAFIREVLEEHQFRVELNEDNLIAHIEGRGFDFMKDRLRILGYLSIHTRQLDMVMARPASVHRYREKFRSDIESLIGA